MVKFLESYYRSHWDEFGCSFPPPRQFRYLLFRRTHQAPKKIILYCIPEGHVEPLFLVKILQDNDDGRQYLWNEFNLLRNARNVLTDGWILKSIPKAWFLEEVEGHLTLVESFMTGKRFYSRRRNPELFQRSLDWLIRFHQATGIWKVLTSESIKTYFVDPLTVFVKDNSPDDDLKAFLSRICDEVNSWSGREIPMVTSHNDFSIANMLFYPNGLSVVDWEFGKFPSLPFADFFNHCLRYVKFNKQLRKRGEINFLDRKYHVVKENLTRYLEALKLSQDDVVPLAAFYFINRYFICRAMGVKEESEMVEYGLAALSRGKIIF